MKLSDSANVVTIVLDSDELFVSDFHRSSSLQNFLKMLKDAAMPQISNESSLLSENSAIAVYEKQRIL